MRPNSAMPVAQRKGQILPRPRSGGLTCSECQVDDVLSKGESTEAEPSLSTDTPQSKPGAGTRKSRV